MSGKIRLAIAGLGNCASSLVQGLEYYKDADATKTVPGLMHVKFGKYHVSDVEIVGAFEVNKLKIGKDISEAIWLPSNLNEFKFSDVPFLNAPVVKGPIKDGVADHMKESFHVYEGDEPTAEDVAKKLVEWKVDVLINFLPVGSEEGARAYAEACLIAAKMGQKVAFGNGMPTFIASDKTGVWPKKFEDAGIPIAGDDIKSQLGATILHRTLTTLALDRGIELDETYQLNIGGNTDFENMKFEDRLATKRISKTEAVTSMLPEGVIVPTRIGPSDYVPFLGDRKICYIYAKGRKFGNMPVSIELKLSVIDSPNSAGVFIDVIRSLKIALDRGISGPITSISSYFFKHPPIQIPDYRAKQLVEEFIQGKIER